MDTIDKTLPSQNQTLDMDALHLKVGDTLHMQIADALDETQYSVRYLGGLKGESIMTTLPVIDGVALRMRPGGNYIFRALTGMHVYAFSTKVIKARSKPFNYAHFEYPENVLTRQVRRAARVRLNLPTRVSGPDGHEVEALLQDLSLNGVLLQTPTAIGAIGALVHVELPVSLDEIDKHLTLSATVRNSAVIGKNPESSHVRYGLEFGRLSNDDTLLLHYFIDHESAKQGA
jgi:c-di-GMP-binding flagellar brake protein YcgR